MTTTWAKPRAQVSVAGMPAAASLGTVAAIPATVPATASGAGHNAGFQTDPQSRGAPD